MKTKSPLVRKTLFLFLMACLPVALRAGDVQIRAYHFSSFATLNTNFEASVDYGNDEDFDVLNFKVNFSVFKLKPDLTWELAYEYETDPTTFGAHTEGTVDNVGHAWTPLFQGRYELRITTTADNDINPDNDDIVMPLVAGTFKSLAFKQYSIINPDLGLNSTWGAVSLKFGMKEKLSFFNIKARNPDTQDVSWIVKNLEIPVLTSDRNSFYVRFNYGNFGYTEGSEIQGVEFIAEESDEPVQEFNTDIGWMLVKPYARDFNMDLRYDYHEGENNALPTMWGSPDFSMTGGFNSISRLGELDRLNLNNEAHPASETYSGDLGNSGPRSLALGFQWLSKYNDGVTLKDKDSTARETMNAFSTMISVAFKGENVTTGNIIESKLQFIDEEEIPVSVGFQSFWVDDEAVSSPVEEYGHKAGNDQAGMTGAAPTWDFIYSNMEAGCAVELLVGLYDAYNVRIGGSWAPVVYASESESTKALMLSEDINEADSMRRSVENSFHFFVEDSIWGRLTGYDGPGWMAFVESAVAQCYDETVTFEEDTTGSTSLDVAYSNPFGLRVYGNPVEPGSGIRFSFDPGDAGEALLEIYSLNGQRVVSRPLKGLSPGVNEVSLPRSAVRGAGTYLLRVRTSHGSSVEKLILH